MKYLLAIACFISTMPCDAQSFPPGDYPRDYFRNPLDIPMSLAANFGELRPNHYHMGLDIRTQKKVNLPVFAAANGYIAHVKIEPEGFGQAIYINHPNGYTTLYAHLNQFYPALAAYIQQQQYKLESWQVFLDIPPGLFPVKKGEFIAYSGSTGGSEGPHLHFEIRRTADDMNLNPLLFGLPVPDSTAPAILKLAIYDRTRSVYEQSPRTLAVHRDGAANSAAATVSVGSPGATDVQGAAKASYSIGSACITVGASRISFALSAFDTQSGSANPNGIFRALLYEDGQAIIGFQMDQIGYDHTRDINAHIDYKTRETGGPFLQHLSRLPGYTAPTIYRSIRDGPGADGVIDLGDGIPHAIRIEVQDANGNTAQLQYRVQFVPPVAAAGPRPANIRARASAEGEDPLIDTVPGTIVKTIYPGMLDGVEMDNGAFYIPERGVYDTVHIRYIETGNDAPGSLPGGVSAVHHIGAPWIPLQSAALIRLHPDRELSDATRGRVVMIRWAGDKKDVERPEWKEGWASCRFREFGSFQLVEDEEAPVITPIGFREGSLLNKAARIAFRVKDNLGTIRSCRAELDGKWLCFTNDKGLAYIYKFDAHCPPGKHVLKIMAEDEAGNRTTKEYRFTR